MIKTCDTKMPRRTKPNRRAERSHSRRETKPNRRAERSHSRRETKPIRRAERSHSRRETKPIRRAERSHSRRETKPIRCAERSHSRRETKPIRRAERSRFRTGTLETIKTRGVERGSLRGRRVFEDLRRSSRPAGFTMRCKNDFAILLEVIGGLLTAGGGFGTLDSRKSSRMTTEQR